MSIKQRFSVVLALALILVTLAAGAALAADATKQVGLVVAFPDGTKHTEIITVPAEATTLDVLQKANIVLVSSTGQFGPTVCSINKVGCDAKNCFCDSKHFWAFYHLDAATNKWVASTEGVGSAKPANGTVEGFVWSGVDANFNPTDQPPVMTFAQLQAQPGAAAAKPATLPTTGGPGLLPAVAGGALALLAAGTWLARRQAASDRA